MKTLNYHFNGIKFNKKVQEKLDEYINILKNNNLKNILIVPPDFTRKHSQAGKITNYIYNNLKANVNIKLLPATGTHKPITDRKINDMFGEDIPKELFLTHNWKEDTIEIGSIPKSFIEEISEGYMSSKISVEINEELLNSKYDLIISIGQVLPHGVVGMANYTKNIVVGCGGKEIINKSHYLGAIYGLERLIGKDHSPVRKLYDYIERKFLTNLPIDYILTVNEAKTNRKTGLSKIHGIYIGRSRESFNLAVKRSQKVNINYIDKPIKKLIVYLDPGEFVSTWLSNKAIYRTRSAIANGGEIIIIAPGLKMIGENKDFDCLIKKYGYVGKENILKLVENNKELQENLAVPAHLIHGSSEDRFKVTYVSDNITKNIINKVNYNYMTMNQLYNNYDIEKLEAGWNTLKYEEIYYIEDPATGLWVTEDHI